MTSPFMNHVSRSLGDHENNYLISSFFNSTECDIVVILVFITELVDGYNFRASLRKVFSLFSWEPPVVPF